MRGERSQALDLFKTLLVVGMVATHVFQLLARSMPGWVDGFADFINLITFSGFLFAMGMGVGLGGDGPKPLMVRLKPALKLLGAAWLSSLAFALLVDRMALSGELVLDVLSLRRLFGWSEFLASFFMLYLLLALGRNQLVRMASDPLALGLSLALAAASTWVIVDANWPLTATLVGTTRFASFPLLPYLPWFLFGIALVRQGQRLRLWHWLGAVVASAALLVFMQQSGGLPGRFPPTLLWVIGAALPLVLYWQVSRIVAGRVVFPAWTLLPGRHVLAFLLFSNLAIFVTRNLMGRPVTSVTAWIGVSTGLLITIGITLFVRQSLEARFRPVAKMP